MASHKIQITYDDATGTITASHRCHVTIGGHVVSHSEPIELVPEAADVLKSLLDGNREEMEGRTTKLAVQHVAAVTGKDKPNVKQLTAGGGLGGLGDSKSVKG